MRTALAAIEITSNTTTLSSGDYEINGDVVLNDGLKVTDGTVNIDLKGHTLSLNSSATNSVIVVTGGGLTITNGTISGGQGNTTSAVHGGGYKRGGGFAIAGGTVVVNNCSIKCNSADFGGGAFIDGGGSLTLENSFVTENSGDGGGIFMDGGILKVNNSTISGNTSNSWAGVAVGEGCDGIELEGNSIIYNNVCGNVQQNLKLGGSGYGNTKGVAVTGALGVDAKFGVSMDHPGVFTVSNPTTYNDAAKFVSDNTNLSVLKNASGQLYLGTGYAVTFDANGHGTAPASQAVTPNSKVTKPADPTAAGWTFGGWYKESGCTTAWNFDADTVASATTLYAKWTVVPATAPTISAQTQNLDLTYGYADGNALSVTAQEREGYTLSYQWYSNTAATSAGGTEISGATSDSYAVPTGKGAGTTEHYYCVVTATRRDNGETATATSEAATRHGR